MSFTFFYCNKRLYLLNHCGFFLSRCLVSLYCPGKVLHASFTAASSSPQDPTAIPPILLRVVIIFVLPPQQVAYWLYRISEACLLQEPLQPWLWRCQYLPLQRTKSSGHASSSTSGDSAGAGQGTRLQPTQLYHPQSLRGGGSSVSVLCSGLRATSQCPVGRFLGISLLLGFLLSLREAVKLLKASIGQCFYLAFYRRG